MPPSRPLPFNYEIGADAAKIRVGDARTAEGELEIHVDGCDTPARGSPAARAGGGQQRRDDPAGAANCPACRDSTICACVSRVRGWIPCGRSTGSRSGSKPANVDPTDPRAVRWLVRRARRGAGPCIFGTHARRRACHRPDQRNSRRTLRRRDRHPAGERTCGIDPRRSRHRRADSHRHRHRPAGRARVRSARSAGRHGPSGRRVDPLRSRCRGARRQESDDADRGDADGRREPTAAPCARHGVGGRSAVRSRGRCSGRAHIAADRAIVRGPGSRRRRRALAHRDPAPRAACAAGGPARATRQVIRRPDDAHRPWAQRQCAQRGRHHGARRAPGRRIDHPSRGADAAQSVAALVAGIQEALRMESAAGHGAAAEGRQHAGASTAAAAHVSTAHPRAFSAA